MFQVRIVLCVVAVAAVIAVLFPVTPAQAQPCGGFIVNGDFEAGNTGFSTVATYDAPLNGLTFGEYTIYTDANAVNGAYCGVDHTSGSGNMAIFDSIVGPAWSQTVNLDPGSYAFSAWVTNVVCYQNLVSPSVELRADGVSVAGPLTLSQDNATWHQLSGSFEVTAAGPVTLEVWSFNGSSNGADWALDDLCLDGTVATEPASWGTVKSLYQ